MNKPIGPLRDYHVVRWRQLAEKRLDHITELFESGRWIKYFSENEFLEEIKRSKALVETWRRLAPAEPDARLPASPFAADDAAASSGKAPPIVAGEEALSDRRGGTDETIVGPALAGPELTPLTDFQFETALGVIALQRLQEAAAFPSQAEQDAA